MADDLAWSHGIDPGSMVVWFGWVFACVHAIPPSGSPTHVVGDLWFLFSGSGQMVALAPNPSSHGSVTPDRSRWEEVVRQQLDGSRRGASSGWAATPHGFRATNRAASAFLEAEALPL